MLALWATTAACALSEVGSTPADVVTVDVRRSETNPGGLDAHVTGTLPDDCARISSVSQTRSGSTINVSILTTRAERESCRPGIRVPFNEVVPLDTEGLRSGLYTVSVNGVSRTFEVR